MDRENSAGQYVMEMDPKRRPLTHAQPAPRRSFWWVWALLFCAFSFATYLFYPQIKKLFVKGAATQQRTIPSIPVVTAVARTGDMNIYLNGLGSVTALNTVTVKSRVDGELIEVGFIEGQLVKKNQLLAQIDPRPFEVQLTQAEGQLVRDKALLENARRDLKRFEEAGAAVSQQERDTAQALGR